jgi:GH43 family beta-xylosidase
VILHNNAYYLTCTTGSNLTIWRSATLAGFKDAQGTVVWKPEGAYGDLRDVWAPELHRIRNKWYIYFSADRGGENATHRIYVLENKAADPLSSTWTMKGELAVGSEHWAIDATILQRGHRLYVIWSGWPGNHDGVQNLYIARLKNPLRAASDRVLLSTPEFEWERQDNRNTNRVYVNEGPQILERGDRIFLVFSASGCWTDNYQLGMLETTTRQDPLNASSWRKLEHPVFSSSANAGAYGTGHNSFFKSPDGSQSWMMYHANSAPGQGCGDARSARAQPFRWTPDGRPEFGIPVPVGELLREPSGTKLRSAAGAR